MFSKAKARSVLHVNTGLNKAFINKKLIFHT